MKLGSCHVITTSTLLQIAKKPRYFVTISNRHHFIYGRISRYYTVKEQDSETGLYYYGARYLDSRTGRWLSGDPAVGDYVPQAPVNDEAKKRNGSLPGMGGVFNYVNLHAYHYAGNNPVKYTDPNGEIIETVWDIASIGMGVVSLAGNIKEGNTGAALLDAAGIVADTAAAIIPGVPGGAGAAIKATRAAATGVAKAAKAAEGAADFGKLSKAAENGGKSFISGLNPSKRDTLLNSATDSKLKGIVDQLYRPGAKIGDGGTADAIRHELKTGSLLSPSGHTVKGRERLNQLNKLLDGGTLNRKDSEMATKLARDLTDALGGN